MRGTESGRRPELQRPFREERPVEGPAGEGGRPRPNRTRSDEMKSESAGAPVAVEEGRCASCGEEIQPVPT